MTIRRKNNQQGKQHGGEIGSVFKNRGQWNDARFNDQVSKKPMDAERQDSLSSGQIQGVSDHSRDGEQRKKRGDRVDQGCGNREIIIQVHPGGKGNEQETEIIDHHAKFCQDSLAN